MHDYIIAYRFHWCRILKFVVQICELVRVAIQKMQADSDHFKVPVELQMVHFEFALEKIRPHTTHEQIAILETFASQNIH